MVTKRGSASERSSRWWVRARGASLKTGISAIGATVLLTVTACGVTNPVSSPTSVAGRYELTTADGAAGLPCCTTTDSSGTATSLASASLTLDQAISQDSVATPAGWMPKACVHQVPNGAHVDTAGVVTLPDGTTYQLSKCQAGSFSLSITNDVGTAGSSTQQRVAQSSGNYSWDGTTLVLVDAAGDELMSGGVTGGALHLNDGQHAYVFSPTR